MLYRFGRTRALMGLFVVLVSLAATATALGFVPRDPTAFRPAGDSRYAWVSASNAVTTTSTSFVDMPDMSVSVTVPSGKQADLFITFSGMMNTNDVEIIRAIIDTTATIAGPGAVQGMSGTGGSAEAHGFTFHKVVDAGTHTVKIQWSTLTTHSFISLRSLMVTANVY